MTPEAVVCEWCGAPITYEDGAWTDRTFWHYEYCSEGLDVGPTGTSPHKPTVTLSGAARPRSVNATEGGVDDARAD